MIQFDHRNNNGLIVPIFLIHTLLHNIDRVFGCIIRAVVIWRIIYKNLGVDATRDSLR